MARFNGRAPYTVSNPASPYLVARGVIKSQRDVALGQPLAQDAPTECPQWSESALDPESGTQRFHQRD